MPFRVDRVVTGTVRVDVGLLTDVVQDNKPFVLKRLAFELRAVRTAATTAASAASTAAAAAAAASAAAAAAAAGSASAAGGGNVHLSGQLAECVLKFNEQVDKRALVGIVTEHGNERGVARVSNKTILMKVGYMLIRDTPVCDAPD